MSIFIDPITQQRVVYARNSGDITYDLVGDKAVSEETVSVIGNWEDYTGSAVVNSRLQQINAGRSNALEGTDPGVKGAKLPDLGIVGQNIQTTRRRVIKRRVEFKDDRGTIK